MTTWVKPFPPDSPWLPTSAFIRLTEEGRVRLTENSDVRVIEHIDVNPWTPAAQTPSPWS